MMVRPMILIAAVSAVGILARALPDSGYHICEDKRQSVNRLVFAHFMVGSDLVSKIEWHAETFYDRNLRSGL